MAHQDEAVPIPASGILNLRTIVTLVIISLLANAIYDIYFGALSKFPGPKTWAMSNIFASLALARGRDHEILLDLHERYGPSIRVGPKQLSFAGGAQAFNDVYGVNPRLEKDGAFYYIDLGAGNSAALTTTPDMDMALSNSALKSQDPILKQWAAKLVQSIERYREETGCVNIGKLYNCATFDIMGQFLFSENLHMLDNGEYSGWVQAVFAGLQDHTLVYALGRIHPWIQQLIQKLISSSKAAKQQVAEHWAYSNERLQRRLGGTPSVPDLWSHIEIKSDSPDALTLAEQQGNASAFMIAGTETSAAALSGVTYYLLRNPSTLSKLTSEVRSAFKTIDKIEVNDLAEMKYLNAVLNEGLRIYPPVTGAFPRVTPPGGTTICGKWVPGGVVVGVHQLANTRINFTKPHEFRPERWLGDPEFEGDDLDAFKPFSVGPHQCVGLNMAWREMRLLLAAVVLSFDLELCDESKNWDNQKVYTLREKPPLMCKITRVGG